MTPPRRPSFLLACAALASASAALAQTEDARILLPEPPARPSVAVDQLQAEDARANVGSPDVVPHGGRPDGGPSVPQVAPGLPNAAPPPPLSDRKEGRPEPVSAIAGDDRCDLQSKDRAAQAICERVIERRAGEFARATPEPSVEQRLLMRVQSQLPEQGAPLARIVGAHPDARNSQELASIVLPSAPSEPSAQTPQAPTDTAAALSEIIESLKIIGQVPPSQ